MANNWSIPAADTSAAVNKMKQNDSFNEGSTCVPSSFEAPEAEVRHDFGYRSSGAASDEAFMSVESKIVAAATNKSHAELYNILSPLLEAKDTASLDSLCALHWGGPARAGGQPAERRVRPAPAGKHQPGDAHILRHQGQQHQGGAAAGGAVRHGDPLPREPQAADAVPHGGVGDRGRGDPADAAHSGVPVPLGSIAGGAGRAGADRAAAGVPAGVGLRRAVADEPRREPGAPGPLRQHGAAPREPRRGQGQRHAALRVQARRHRAPQVQGGGGDAQRGDRAGHMPDEAEVLAVRAAHGVVVGVRADRPRAGV
ncbi:DHHC zinc finger domain/ankyrin repeat containing protein, putative [Babesia caballi]|uniref:DHHC zinc finger domain/ankyrin repeat containing protein, putative n=1 Tax=Babesia caballi TaxID=5871 RepID=A0AAV4LZL8_BABCB|nr:DHHC zinc finger domain/ankyrin repeat containing protein, putative [Babesia caballi]